MRNRKFTPTRLAASLSLLAVAAAGSIYGEVAPGATRSGGSGQYAATASPAYCLAMHDIGGFRLGVSNNGTISSLYSSSGQQDCFTGERVPALEYPKGSNSRYLFGAAFWIGAVVGRDTLVSVGLDGWSYNSEFNPDEPPIGNMIFRSTIDPTKPEYEGAISEQDYIGVYTDTFTSGVQGLGNDVIDGRPHLPINVEVTQRSFAWSYSYAEDFVLFDYAIKNIGHQRLKRVFLGIYVDADVHAEANLGGFADDICGFLHSIDAAYLPRQCPDSDVVNLAFISDNDGDLTMPPGMDVPHVTGVRVVRAPQDSLEVSFNWWVGNATPALDFGPQTVAEFRDLSTGGTGTPEGDRNKYAFLSNGEFDYDQIFTAAINPVDYPEWMAPNPLLANDLADGFDTRYLLSFGPFDIEPGQVLPLSFAYVAGADMHTDPTNINNLAEGPPYDPEEYYRNVDFSDLGANATWAEWIYDNPGVDTDSDGYSGVFYPCTTSHGDPPVIKQIARRGDGVPDFKGANPPPAPYTRVEPSIGGIRVVWNGARSETTVDNFSGEIDFEGYRVYIGRDERRSSLSVLQSYDFENYNKWVWDDSLVVGGLLGGFDLKESPFSLDRLRCLYAPNGCNDTVWHPSTYPRNNPFASGDSLFYFEPQDFNRSVLANEETDSIVATTEIRKLYPDALIPEQKWIEHRDSIPDSIWSNQVLLDSLLVPELLAEGDTVFKYYEYEFVVEDLLPTIPYWINVTAFDYGSPQSGLPSLETSPTILPSVSYAMEGAPDPSKTDELSVYVWPNPYRLDAGYRSSGYEGFFEDERTRPDDRVRRIHFGGLPPRCTIRIYTLDGDLVREIDHDIDPGDPLASHDSWDMITRNTQLAVSGLYYWTVEADGFKTQIGKLVLIL
ncbi:MAG: hypothetical protein JSU65_06855 [Candidatus Zixiibacteriota bacterium]|nr:MAG: hypothetical protein JSU65_06855 [candidate division Zixibacteria bacterium]